MEVNFSSVRHFRGRIASTILPYWIAGAMTALVAIGFYEVFHYCEDFAYYWAEHAARWGFVIIPLGLLMSALLAKYLAPEATGSGIPQIIAAVELSEHKSPTLDRLLSLKTAAVKFAGTCLSVAAGGITGREGPMLQISAAIFHSIQERWPRAKVTAHSMILAGGAAGLAAAFNTPLGGIVFAIEELAKVHLTHIRTQVFQAVIIAGFGTQLFLGNYLYIGHTEFRIGSMGDLFGATILAGLGGIAGALFSAMIVRALDFREKLAFSKQVAMTLLCGLSLAVLLLMCGTAAIGSGKSIILSSLHGTRPQTYALFSLRFLANLLTYVSGAIGGIFAPALAIGASLGGWFANYVGSTNPQLWVLTGMVAFLTGVTRTPLTSFVLVLEMTDSHNGILYLILSGLVANAFAEMIDPVGFYEYTAKKIIAKDAIIRASVAPGST